MPSEAEGEVGAGVPAYVSSSGRGFAYFKEAIVKGTHSRISKVLIKLTLRAGVNFKHLPRPEYTRARLHVWLSSKTYPLSLFLLWPLHPWLTKGQLRE